MRSQIATGVISVIGKEGRNASGIVASVVVRKLSIRKKLCPIILLVRCEASKKLLKNLVNSLSLTVGLGMVS